MRFCDDENAVKIFHLIKIYHHEVQYTIRVNKRFSQETDVIHLIKSIRTLETLLRITLTSNQIWLLSLSDLNLVDGGGQNESIHKNLGNETDLVSKIMSTKTSIYDFHDMTRI